MITKSEWLAVNRQLIDEERRKSGDLPSDEELLAYANGELTEEREERIREVLSVHPELVRALMHPFPEEEAEAFSDEEISQHWADLQRRLPSRTAKDRSRFWRIAVAAVVTVLAGTVVWQAQRGMSPHILASHGESQILLPDGRRGGEAATPISSSGDLALTVTVIGSDEVSQYRIDLIDESGRTLWRSKALPRNDKRAFTVGIPRSFLESGTYQFALYGLDGPAERRLTTYSFRLPQR